jgi:hypothetical protein
MRIPTQTEAVQRDRKLFPYRGVEPDEFGVYPSQDIDDVFDEDDD